MTGPGNSSLCATTRGPFQDDLLYFCRHTFRNPAPALRHDSLGVKDEVYLCGDGAAGFYSAVSDVTASPSA